MVPEIEITPCGPITGSIRPPGSKSLTNRALIIAALAEGTSTLTGALESEDTEVMIDSLRRIGVAIEHDAVKHTLTVHGNGGKFGGDHVEMFIANSGTSMRFLTALATLGQGSFRLDGIARMRERPIGDLIEALKQLGADIRTEQDNACPPVLVNAQGLPGGQAKIAGNISSQYLSGLLMAAPYARRDVELEVDGELVSQPYVRMTTHIMRDFGASVEENDCRRFVIPGQQTYQAREYAIEPDASAASYFWGAAAVTGGKVTVAGLSRDALQGDVGFCEALAQMGCQVDYAADSITVTGQPLQGIEIDMGEISDTVQTLAAVALFAAGPTKITGVAHNRHKETDRIGDLACELRKLGATVEELPDGLVITPGTLQPAKIETYNDHRMAMSLALVGLQQPGVVILNPSCTSKTYPHFFEDLAKICGTS
ncbi:3-phosphoshikimate 1-carboxyvinyltransferase [Blastopirellula marina]|uniref:3-phosphoshikimate 1-carboxyvinyltransferase n=1 Tax=Blastopirellula marina TaxID=124 RepID=A0A2S8GDR0_9BACT|nr:3-phosphoshikimate 1-carboxyvinyltransferase [Blastopirellula marina]PQO42579.1 3-phosphoshikimate 1-carboxyvinyltransferase [Blastopirellula marina]PTL46345.1 3-phosphoshikimate 1-carboxyvinyltransferase [Blastopirellula marina]